jgi:hypothetical protein
VQNPSHTYANPGWYDVNLFVSGPSGDDTELKLNYIHATQPADSAWLAQDATGDPVLSSYQTAVGAEAELHMILSNGSDTAHSVMFPVCYDTGYFDLVSVLVDSSALPMSEYGVWNIFERDTVENDSGKAMLYAWTATYAAGIPTGRSHLGTLTLTATDTGSTVVDTCLYPPQNLLIYTHGPTASDYWPIWFPLDVTILEALCGDANGDGQVTSGDGFQVLNYLGSGPGISSCWSANVNGDGSLTPGDGYHLLNYFGGGPGLTCAPCTQTASEPEVKASAE